MQELRQRSLTQVLLRDGEMIYASFRYEIYNVLFRNILLCVSTIDSLCLISELYITPFSIISVISCISATLTIASTLHVHTSTIDTNHPT